MIFQHKYNIFLEYRTHNVWSMKLKHFWKIMFFNFKLHCLKTQFRYIQVPFYTENRSGNVQGYWLDLQKDTKLLIRSIGSYNSVEHNV